LLPCKYYVIIFDVQQNLIIHRIEIDSTNRKAFLMPHVEILVGSLSDLPYLQSSDLPGRLDAAGISYAVSACSAHRNTSELAERIEATMPNTAAYVCGAGWAAALPGAVKALLLGRSLAAVYGVALPSEEYPDGQDAEISIKRLPPGVAVFYGGVGADAFSSIADDVIASAKSYDPANPNPDILNQVKAKIKPPQFDIPLPKEAR
jgi:phosphoribosylcarboxyaminoimidazole (NCAIR) mutase